MFINMKVSWLIVGPMRALAGDDTTPGTGGGSGTGSVVEPNLGSLNPALLRWLEATQHILKALQPR